MNLRVVLLAGGGGTRFWPASRAARPKQFLRLGEKSLIRATFDRLLPRIPAERIYVVAPQAYRTAIGLELPELPHDNVVVEPSPRNTAPAIGLAMAHLLRVDPTCVAAVLPADHELGRPHRFLDLLATAETVARREGALVTLGIPPTHAATGFGYIEIGEPVLGYMEPAHRALRFHEKPDAAQAAMYVSSGGFLWNSGMFVWKPRVFLEELSAAQPAAGAAFLRVADASASSLPEAIRAAYRTAEPMSVDYAVLEHSQKVIVMPADIDWNDLGTWAAAKAGRARKVLEVLAHGNLVIASDKKVVALVGVQDLIVIDTEDALLICSVDKAEEVRTVVERLKAAGIEDVL